MPGLLRGVARTAVVAGTASAVANRVSRRQAGRWAAQEQRYAPPPGRRTASGPAPAPVAAPADDMSGKLAALEKLAALKAKGVLSETEFVQQKARVLGS